MITQKISGIIASRLIEVAFESFNIRFQHSDVEKLIIDLFKNKNTFRALDLRLITPSNATGLVFLWYFELLNDNSTITDEDFNAEVDAAGLPRFLEYLFVNYLLQTELKNQGIDIDFFASYAYEGKENEKSE